VADEWDPWKRYIKHKERLLWDDWYRYQYERDRMQWDPFYRYMKEQDRLSWDPYFRLEKEIERKHWFPTYQQSRGEFPNNELHYMERSWGNEYQERRRRELMEHGFTQSNSVQLSSVSPSERVSPQISSGISLETAGSSYVPYVSGDEELPSLAAVLAEGIIPPAIVGYFALAMYFGWGSASPFALALLFMFASIFLGAAEARRATALLLIYSILLLLLEPWAMFGDPHSVRRIYFDSLVKATIVLSIIGALYVVYWWKKIR